MVKKVKKKHVLIGSKTLLASNSHNSKNTTWILTPFFSFSNKTFIVNVSFIESARTIYNFPFLFCIFKISKSSISLQSSDSMSHFVGPKYETLLLPWRTYLTRGLENLEICLSLYQLSPFCLKISFIIGGGRFLLSRNISIIRYLFLMWIKTEPFISSSSENYGCLSL